jgi:hypothetical protein
MSVFDSSGNSLHPFIVISNSGSTYVLPEGINTASLFVSESDWYAFVEASSSFKFGPGNSNSDNLTFSNPKESTTLFYISASTPNSLVGLGTTNPLSNLDIRSTTGSSPANLILRTNEDGVVQEGEETGRIIFAIESSSFLGTNFIASGSTAAIFSRVTNAGSNGAYGSLIFEVNDSNNRTQPFEILELGYEVGGFVTGQAGARISGSLEVSSEFPTFNIKNPINGNSVIYIGPTTSDILAYIGGGDAVDRGNFFLYNDGNTKVKLNTTTTSFINDGNNLAIGTTTAPEQLTVEGSISASGNIIGTINGGSF